MIESITKERIAVASRNGGLNSYGYTEKLNNFEKEYEPMKFVNIENAKSSINFNYFNIIHNVYSGSYNGMPVRTGGGYVAQVDENGKYNPWTYKPKEEGIMSVSIHCRFNSIPAQVITVIINQKPFDIYIPEIAHCSSKNMTMAQKFFVSQSGATFTDNEWENREKISINGQYQDKYIARSAFQQDNPHLQITIKHCEKMVLGSEDQKDHPVMIKYREKVNNDCYYHIALQDKNVALCNELSNTGYKMKCINKITKGEFQYTSAADSRRVILPAPNTLGLRDALNYDTCQEKISNEEITECNNKRNQAQELMKRCETDDEFALTDMSWVNNCFFTIARKIAGHKECKEYSFKTGCNCRGVYLYKKILARDPEIYNLLPSGTTQNQCLYYSAIETQNPFLCEYINDLAIHYRCYIKVAEAADQPAFCDNIDNENIRKDCYRKIVGIDLIPKGNVFCDAIRNNITYDRCYDVISELQRFCAGTVKSVNTNAYCYWGTAVKQHDFQYCTDAQIIEIMNLCQYETCQKADQETQKQLNCFQIDYYKNKELERCATVPNWTDIQQKCYRLVAHDFSDPDICNFIEGTEDVPMAKDYCYQTIAVTLDDDLICENIEDNKIKEICKQYLIK